MVSGKGRLDDLPIAAGDFIWTPPGEAHVLYAETEVVIHVTLPGPIVLTERTDVLRYKRWESAFWVCGTFEVRDGLIALWDDHFSMGNVVAASLRGLAGVVGAVVAREHVRRLKPAPDSYLLAARLLGAEPTRCVAYENSDEGITAAGAAGMDVIDVRARARR